MTNGGKDIKFGQDKRPVSVVPAQEFLYNIFNGEVLTDAFGQPLFADQDIIFINDALANNSTSIVLPVKSDSNTPGVITSIGNTVVTYYYNNSNNIGINTSNLKIGDSLSGKYIQDGTTVSRIGVGSIFLSNNATNTAPTTEPGVEISRRTTKVVTYKPTIKIEEKFKETSEVSTNLLGIPRAETQLSLFSDVASYGLDVDQWETSKFRGNPNNTSDSWRDRKNKIYGNRFISKLTEETNESALKLEAFPTPYTFPFGPNFEKLGSYEPDLFQNFLRFVNLGNELYNFFDEFGTSLGYPSSWKNNFLPETAAKVESGDIVYSENLDFAFAIIDDWTETWRNMRDTQLIDPITNEPFTFVEAARLNTITKGINSTNSRPGYRSNYRNYIILQSKQNFKYQPGRISGFTFGSSCSAEPVSGYVSEFGIFNDSDEYVFRVDRGDLSIVRRSTIPLSGDVLFRNQLESEDQTLVSSSDPFKPILLYEVVISRDKFNGDPLNGNGPSGYQIQLPNVTMYKIEFGWYGAIGAKFYAYIPAGSGETRWVALHTLILENQLNQPCLKAAAFKFKYQVDVTDNTFIRQPVFLYKYGSSFYIDGGDEGNFETNTETSKLKSITNTSGPQSLFGIVPKANILSSSGGLTVNNKVVIPKKLTVNSDSLIKVNIINCEGCPDGFGYTYGPGVATTENGRSLNIKFNSPSRITALGDDDYFYESDKGAKLIGKTLWDVYIEELDGPVGTAGSFRSAKLSRPVGGELVRDSGITTSIGIGSDGDYPYPVRLSNYDGLFVSSYRITGSKVDIEFLNPALRDNGTNAGGQVADFRIGFTNVEPDVNRIDGDIFNVSGVGFGYTTKLPEERYLFAENKNRALLLTENGIETGERNNDPFTNLEIDITTPQISGSGGGVCSRISLEVQPSLSIPSVSYSDTNPDPLKSSEAGNFLVVNGRFPELAIDEFGNDTGYNNGEITLEGDNNQILSTNVRYVGITSTFTPDPAKPRVKQSYIKISDNIENIPDVTGPTYKLFVTPLKLSFTEQYDRIQSKTSIFNYNPFPLYFVVQLRDNSAVNSFSIKETIGLNQKVLSPIQTAFTYSNKLSLTNADGNADLVGLSPPNFLEVGRLSSLKIDTLNQQKLRVGPQTRIIDTFYIGENDSRTVDLSKIFGLDRYKIIRNRRSNQGVFIVAENISSNVTANVEMSLNYIEQ